MAGLLLSAVPAGDNDHQRRRTAGRCAAARRSAANAGSVMFTAAGEGRTQPCLHKATKATKATSGTMSVLSQCKFKTLEGARRLKQVKNMQKYFNLYLGGT